MTHNNQQHSGMALVSVLIFSAIAIVVIVAGISLTTITSQSNRIFLQGQRALHVAEAGVENALMRLLRNPDYANEVLTMADGTARIVVTQIGELKIITVTGEVGTSIRTVEVQTSFNNGVMVVESWREIY
jgi:type II secretory pathway component PulK